MYNKNVKRRKKLKVEIKLEENCSETKAIIVTDKMTEEISQLSRCLANERSQELIGFDGENAELLDQTDIIRIYASNGKVYALTDRQEYALRMRLYEVEEKLNNASFVRISYSEIINIKKVKKFDLSLVGTIRVSLSNGDISYVSRRYVKKIKQTLGL